MIFDKKTKPLGVLFFYQVGAICDPFTGQWPMVDRAKGGAKGFFADSSGLIKIDACKKSCSHSLNF